MGDTQPPLEYLVASSQSSLESYLLSRSIRLAELRHQIRGLLNEWVHIQGDERVARGVLECRRPAVAPLELAALQPCFFSTLDLHALLSLPPAEEDMRNLELSRSRRAPA
jgi:hypothetical protein